MLQQALTFLILGGGSIGTRHIRNLQKLGYTDIYCLKRKADQEFAATNQVQVITSVEELEGKPVHAVFVCTPTSLHNQGMSIAKTLNACCNIIAVLVAGWLKTVGWLHPFVLFL